MAKNQQPLDSLPSMESSDTADDSVLTALKQAEHAHREFRADAERQAAELTYTAATLAQTRSAHQSLADELETLRHELEQERRKTSQQRDRANQLAMYLKDIHRSLFRGSIYNLILKACLTLTGATRGLYITMRGLGDQVHIRAAVDIDGYPQSPPSAYITALCNYVLTTKDTFVCNDPGDTAGLPEPTEPSERFRNCVVAPVVLLRNFDGIIIIADKPHGEFEEDDIELLLSVGDQAGVAVENVQLQRELQTAYVSTVSLLADVVEAKDAYTLGHCEQASRYARLTAERLQLRDEERSIVCYAALLHDVGKIGVSDGILNKPGALLPAEWALMQSHVQVGHDLISNVPALIPVADIVLHHHERYDGTGYPDGLQGETIPLAARIISVVDAYCAMITKRSYKEAYTDEHARSELIQHAGTQFDPVIVEAFLAMIDTPEAQDHDADEAAECGLLPGFGDLRNIQRVVG